MSTHFHLLFGDPAMDITTMDPVALDVGHLPTFLRWLLYLAVIMAIVICGQFGSQQFIYFQF